MPPSYSFVFFVWPWLLARPFLLERCREIRPAREVPSGFVFPFHFRVRNALTFSLRPLDSAAHALPVAYCGSPWLRVFDLPSLPQSVVRRRPFCAGQPRMVPSQLRQFHARFEFVPSVVLDGIAALDVAMAVFSLPDFSVT